MYKIKLDLKGVVIPEIIFRYQSFNHIKMIFHFRGNFAFPQSAVQIGSCSCFFIALKWDSKGRRSTRNNGVFSQIPETQPLSPCPVAIWDRYKDLAL